MVKTYLYLQAQKWVMSLVIFFNRQETVNQQLNCPRCRTDLNREKVGVDLLTSAFVALVSLKILSLKKKEIFGGGGDGGVDGPIEGGKKQKNCATKNEDKKYHLVRLFHVSLSQSNIIRCVQDYFSPFGQSY